MEISSSMFAIVFVAAFLACYGAMYWLDGRYGWQLVAWSNGEVKLPFEDKASTASCTGSETELTELRKRVEALEKIVTDSAYELNEKLRKL
jgi:hypothetical protein